MVKGKDISCEWQTILCQCSHLGDPPGNFRLCDSSLTETLVYEKSMNISFSYILFSPWPISKYTLCSPEQRKNCQSHVVNISALFATKNCSSQDWILFTNNESFHMLSAYCKWGQELRDLNETPGEILMTTLGVKYKYICIIKMEKLRLSQSLFIDPTV